MYVIIEKFPEPVLMCDETGKVLQFEDIDEAAYYAKENCQNGKVVNLN